MLSFVVLPPFGAQPGRQTPVMRNQAAEAALARFLAAEWQQHSYETVHTEPEKEDSVQETRFKA